MTQEAVHSAVPPEAGSGFQRAEARGRGESIPKPPATLPALHSAELAPVTESDDLRPAPAGWQEAADRAQRAFTRISSGVSVLHAQPPSLAETRERHHRAAGQWNALAMVWPRIIYGYGHLCVKALLHCIEWVLESPPRVVIAAVVIYVFLFRS